jgi:hypothetical protein
MIMSKKETITVQGTAITLLTQTNGNDYVCITDIAKYRSSAEPFAIINNWMRSRSTIEFIGLWEQLNNPNFNCTEFGTIKNSVGGFNRMEYHTINNPDFNSIEFDGIKNIAGSNSFSLTPERWIEATTTIGIVFNPHIYEGIKNKSAKPHFWMLQEVKNRNLINEYKRLRKGHQKERQ